ncbi:H(+)-transporting V1 sector ATPase subunit A [Penicillium herquei]|nr:H(+)-transporting V1 sector ATPase subunit A [Penicillium herquei]
MRGSYMHELVVPSRYDSLVGEITKIEREKVPIQIYKETCGVAIGDPVTGTGQPLAVELGSGLMGTIYDGTQEPLEAISCLTKSIYIPRGIDAPAPNREKTSDFKPGTFNIGDHITGGDIWGSMFENNWLDEHKIIHPPRARGRITRIAEAGSHTVIENLFTIEFEWNETEYSMMHIWPVRVPRPITEIYCCNYPIFTGQRVLDSLFPCPQGGTVYVPGAFGSISQSISKFSNSDVIVYFGCGARGNEIAEVLMEFSRLSINVNGRRDPITRRSCLVANTSNMRVAAREASIYTSITISEYFRDQVKSVTLIADSISRRAEALREIFGLLEEMPADEGFLAFLGSKLASFDERAPCAMALDSPRREGSISIIGAVFWALDKKAHAEEKGFLPSIPPYSKYSAVIEANYEKRCPEFPELRDKMKKILSDSEV